MDKKICSKCGIEKDLSEFRQYKSKYKGGTKLVYKSQCRECELKYKKEYYKEKSKDESFKEKNRSRAKKYRDENIEVVRKREKEYRENHREQAKKYYYENKEYFSEYKKSEKYKKQQQEYRNSNREEISKKNREYKQEYKATHREEYLEKRKSSDKKYRENHKEERRAYIESHRDRINEKKRIYEKVRRETDPLYKFEKQIRGMINSSFARKKLRKNSRTYKIIGCDFATFYEHLLKSYKDIYGKEWDGKSEVHIDHVIPLVTANTEEEIIKLCHYTNLQLLKPKDNLEKSSKLDWKLKDE